MNKSTMSLAALGGLFALGPLPNRPRYHAPVWTGVPRSSLGPGRLTHPQGVNPKRRAKRAQMAALNITSARQWRNYRKQAKRAVGVAR